MYKTIRFLSCCATLMACQFIGNVTVIGGDSHSVQRGEMLFAKEFASRNPLWGSDGLGPLFNATSCVGCHHQGGMGGSGDSRFNAKAMGIDRLSSSGPGGIADVLRMVSMFHPFYVANGQMLATVPLPHFGGSSAMETMRRNVRYHSPAVSAPEGGDLTAADVRRNAHGNYHWVRSTHRVKVEIDARVYQRNTTSLFGAGMIDAIGDRTLIRLAREQARHPEVSGRVALIRGGGIGRFGWRANRERLHDFVESACIAELGLQTGNGRQLTDVATPDYINPGVDLQPQDVSDMTAFVNSLPTPTRSFETVSQSRANVGEHLFNQVGCAACHVKDVSPASGLYSDLLLHDMGPNLYDYDTAEPEIRKQIVFENVATTETISGETEMPRYYGSGTQIVRTTQTRNVGQSMGDSSSARFTNQVLSSNGAKVINTPRSHLGGQRTFVLDRKRSRIVDDSESKSSTGQVMKTRKEIDVVKEVVAKQYTRPGPVSQEWRTPPLWGVADSGPYMHDGRAETLTEAIAMHAGESRPSRGRFLALNVDQRQAIVDFMRTLVSPKTAH